MLVPHLSGTVECVALHFCDSPSKVGPSSNVTGAKFTPFILIVAPLHQVKIMLPHFFLSASSGAFKGSER